MTMSTKAMMMKRMREREREGKGEWTVWQQTVAINYNTGMASFFNWITILQLTYNFHADMLVRTTFAFRLRDLSVFVFLDFHLTTSFYINVMCMCVYNNNIIIPLIIALLFVFSRYNNVCTTHLHSKCNWNELKWSEQRWQ